MNEQTGARDAQCSHPAPLETVIRRAVAAMATLMGTWNVAAEPSVASDSAEGGGPEYTVIEEVVVTGSRILRDPVNEPTATMQIGAAGLERTGFTNLGDALQNNVFDEDPPLCFPCGVIGMSTVVHDLPGRVGYVRIAYRR